METTETTEQPKEQALKINQVNAFNTTQEVLDELKETYGSLIIAGVDDKDGYKAVKEGLAKCVSLRNKVDKRRLALKKEVDKVGGDLQSIIGPIESHLEKQKKKIDDQKALDAQKAKQAEEKLFKDRTDELFKHGAGFNGVVYALGSTYITPSEIQSMSDEFFKETSAKFEAAAKEIADKEKAVKDAESSMAIKLKEIADKEKEIDEKLKKLEALQALANPETIAPDQTVSTVTQTGETQEVKTESVITAPGENKAADMLANMGALETIVTKTGKGSIGRSLPKRDAVTPVVTDEKTTQETTTAPVVEEIKETGDVFENAFSMGFKACQEKLLLFVSNRSNPLTREILIAKITDLKS